MSQIDLAAIERTREQVRVALASTDDAIAREALQASLELLDSLAVPQAKSTANYSGSMNYTFMDDDCAPFGREIDVRIHYNWSDYNRADEPFPLWGATIEAAEVLAVRYFNDDGEVVSLVEHLGDIVDDLLNKQDELLTEACTEDGYRKGAGEAPSWFSAAPAQTSPLPKQSDFAARMASSLPTRQAEQHRERLG